MNPLTDVWWMLFVNRTDGALRESRGGWRFDPTPLTKNELERALRGRQPLGVYATDTQGLARWVCWDADTEAGRDVLATLSQTMEPGTYLFEPSRRGAHLWRFCPPTPWRAVRAYGEHLLEGAGIRCEVFPKGEGRTGVRLPLTPHTKTGHTYPVIDPASGEILSVETLQELRPAPLPEVPPRREMRGSATETTGRGDFVSLVQEAERFTRLRQYGPERAVGRCPFHDDRHPSFSILGGFWRCWAGCGEGGIAEFRRQVELRGWR